MSYENHHGELEPSVITAVGRLFSEDSGRIADLLRESGGGPRVHRIILAMAMHDSKLLESLCKRCATDVRDVLKLEDEPEEHWPHIPRKDDAAAELARRYDWLDFVVPSSLAYWGQWSKNWRPEWSIGPFGQ
ncbi:hypothetical protein OVA24_08465 [Luteolibacter sp. SL250]|uniref:hypothetical protein n=1 Tax=Luteolibacter sp. SL250 TaxID=2995170 RepID=UPI00226EBA30|nr:hypothetical protein [Luteolibacter sp. SL250]WAC21418.1 hypothetical protein OVA24_08465 [Luteolibacter sp. SL250]